MTRSLSSSVLSTSNRKTILAGPQVLEAFRFICRDPGMGCEVSGFLYAFANQFDGIGLVIAWYIISSLRNGRP